MWLDKLVDATRQRVHTGYYEARPDEQLASPGSLARAIREADPAIVAEIKPARPDGTSYDVDPERQAATYAEGGAQAISVLTDSDHFDGSLENLQAARGAELPLLMKDFLIHPAQIEAARAWGASAVLAIARLPREGYTDYTLDEMCQDAHEAGLEVLAEVVTEAELDQALQARADVIGINVRDLDTLEIDRDRPRRLLAPHSLDVPALYLSGIESADDIRSALDAGTDGALVGSSLMAAEDPAQRLQDLRGGSR